MITPEEAAKLTYIFSLQKDDAKVKSFILEASPRQIQEFIHLITADATSSYFNWARVALDIRLAEEAAKTAQEIVTGTEKLVQHSENLTQQTDRLVTETLELRRFTTGVFWLTTILVLVAILQIYQIFSHN